MACLMPIILCLPIIHKVHLLKNKANYIVVSRGISHATLWNLSSVVATAPLERVQYNASDVLVGGEVALEVQLRSESL
jgi:hypothetical protein